MQPGRASSTARLIAAAVVMARYDPCLRALVPPEAADWSARFLRTDAAWLLGLMQSRAGRWAARLVERLLLSGIVRHWVVRKQAIEAMARRAASEGFSQLMVLGAGFDSLAFRLTTDLTFARAVEADHPDTQRVVSRTLDVTTREVDVRRRVALVPIDLGHGTQLDSLAQSLDPVQPTFIVCEGVLMYLREPQVRSLLQALHDLPFPRARLIATFMSRQPGEPIGFRSQNRLVGAWLRGRGEPMRWASTSDEFVRLLSDTGWRSLETHRASDLRRQRFPGANGPDDEDIMLADRIA